MVPFYPCAVLVVAKKRNDARREKHLPASRCLIAIRALHKNDAPKCIFGGPAQCRLSLSPEIRWERRALFKLFSGDRQLTSRWLKSSAPMFRRDDTTLSKQPFSDIMIVLR